MCILKRLRKALKEKKEEETPCWYNNSHEKCERDWETPTEGQILTSPNEGYYVTAKQASKLSW